VGGGRGGRRGSYPVVMAVTVGLCGMLYDRFKRSGWL